MKSINSAAKYLSDLGSRFEADTANNLENLKFTAAAYNSGRGGVNGYIITQHGKSAFGQGDLTWDGLVADRKDLEGATISTSVRDEAQGYVKNIFYSDKSNSGQETGYRYNHYQNLIMGE